MLIGSAFFMKLIETDIYSLLFVSEAPLPINVVLSINHSVFVKGDHTNFEIEPSFGVEASELYPDVKYTTVEEYLDQFV
jgi:pterocarpan reductase